MNKKFSTLVAALGFASVALASSVQAASVECPTDHANSIEKGKAYQLAVDGKVLVMQKQASSTDYTLKMVDPSLAPSINSTLWTVEAHEVATAGPDFVFVNKATGCPLTVNLSDVKTTAEDVVVDGAVSTWKWLPVVNDNTPKDYPVVHYFKGDSVVYLSTTNEGQVQVLKGKADKLTNPLKFYSYNAKSVVLSAKDLNTKLGSDEKGSTFKLSSDWKTSADSKYKNIFCDNTLHAWNGTADANEAEGNNHKIYALTQTVFSSITNDYVLLQVVDSEKDVEAVNGQFLVADTAEVEGKIANVLLPRFGTDTLATTLWPAANSKYISNSALGRIPESYMFKFTYFPTQDSLAISVLKYQVKGAQKQEVNGKETEWNQVKDDMNYVSLNNLVGTSELTLYAKENENKNIKFTLGLGNDGRVSVADGLYYIKNKKGQYLAVPIDEEGYDEAKWVTVKAKEQAVAHMPAYQWVVLKNNTLAPLSQVSSLAVTNREFTDVKDNAAQLYKTTNAKYNVAVVSGESLKNAFDDAVEFVKIEDKAVLGDKYLGYMNLDKQALSVMNYKLNYLHPYAFDKYIGGHEGDSLLAVFDNQIGFYFTKSVEANYGYEVKEANNRIAGLVQLVRSEYTPYVKTVKGPQYIDLNEEDQYFISANNKDVKKFYFKENNFFEPADADAARPYYAMIDLKTVVNNQNTKVGTTDDDMSAILKNQVLHETRTSAFAVVENDAPLYRRFNTVLENAVEGQEDAGKILKFQESYRNEYLMDEANENFKNELVNYLGIWTEEKANAGLSFRVDTAVLLKTPAGKIKPQYFITVANEEVEAVAGIPCQETNHEHRDINGKVCDAEHCIHATPAKAGYNVSKYLVSFKDSLQTPNADKLYQFGKYTRVGFVKGLHIGDSLIFLVNGFDKVAANKLDTAEILKNYNDAKIAGTYIKDLSKLKDDHHNFTWSFRYIDPEKAANLEEADRKFLIESSVEDPENTDLWIAPTNAAWIKIQNGCLVLSDPKESTFENAKTGGDNAAIFNIEVGSEDNMATENEEIATEGVSVVAGNGVITVQGAAGKNIVVANILGKVVANTVATSDNATITVPAGVVVVTVDGETVKAIVK